MCRFIVYKGTEPIHLSHLVTRPHHSITNQAYECQLRFQSSRPFNADGAGVAWYDVEDPPHSVSTPSTTPSPPGVVTDGKAGRKVVPGDRGANVDADGTGGPGTGMTTTDAVVLTKEDVDAVPNPGLGPRRGSGRGGGLNNTNSKPIRSSSGGSAGKESSIPEHRPEDSTSHPHHNGNGNARAATSSTFKSTSESKGSGNGNENGRSEGRDGLVQDKHKPCIFKSITPAWNNANLARLAEKVKSRLVFAHVRASTMAGAPNEDNCHPWSYGRLLWMHNGEIAQFSLIKRKLQSLLPDELYLLPQGYTDSEWAFSLFLSKLKNPLSDTFTSGELRKAMLDTIRSVNEMHAEVGVTSPSLMNFVVSDGENVVATRYISSKTSDASSLFFSSGTTFEEYAAGGHYRMNKADKRENIFMLASEPLTFEEQDWQEVKTNTMLVITPKMNLLQIPIIDEFYTPADEAQRRSAQFATSKGFGAGLDIRPHLE